MGTQALDIFFGVLDFQATLPELIVHGGGGTELQGGLAGPTSSLPVEAQRGTFRLTRQMGMVKDLSAMAQLLLEEERQDNSRVAASKVKNHTMKKKHAEDKKPDVENASPTKKVDMVENVTPVKNTRKPDQGDQGVGPHPEKVDPACKIYRPRECFIRNRPHPMPYAAALEAWKTMDDGQRAPYRAQCAAWNLAARQRALEATTVPDIMIFPLPDIMIPDSHPRNM